jgi:hypothetical protein
MAILANLETVPLYTATVSMDIYLSKSIRSDCDIEREHQIGFVLPFPITTVFVLETLAMHMLSVSDLSIRLLCFKRRYGLF